MVVRGIFLYKIPMGLFGKKSKPELKANENEVGDNIIITERPRICCLDMSEETISVLQNSGANVYKGTLGSKVKVPNTSSRDWHQILLNFNFPQNLHEYDIIIIDLDSFDIIDYRIEDYVKEVNTGKSSSYLLSSYPENVFDPRPMASSILKHHLKEISNREYLVLVFSSKSYDIDYETLRITEDGYRRQPSEKYNIYSFWNSVPTSTAKYGTEISVCKMREDLRLLLEKYKPETVYNQTFYHPTTRIEGKNIQDERYFPLITNMNGEIVSFLELNKYEQLIMLPQIKDKSNFILDFLSKVAPSIYPNLFPFSTTFSWKNQKEYWLPLHSELLSEKSNIQKEFEHKLEENERKIKENSAKYSFLHSIVTETGDTLVNSLIQYLKWLEFDKVINFDHTNSKPNVLEEDIQVELANGLLIIECKGIGGTSTDSDCSQVSKIKHRRCKERNKFDVKAYDTTLLYQDLLDEFKWELSVIYPFISTKNLVLQYFEIEKGIITKEEARKSILEFGLIEFRPEGLSFVNEPTEILKDGKVCIVNIDNLPLSVNDELFIEKNGKFEKAILLEIRLNDTPLQTASQGELGLKLSSKIERKSILWKRVTNR